MINIWERYFIKEFLKTSLFFLFCFYGLYALVDYASNLASGHSAKIRLLEVGTYYFYDFVRRLDTLLPLAMLIGTVRTLCSLNVHNELIALVASGINLSRLMRPFIFCGLFGVSILYLNNQFILPHALYKLRLIDNSRINKKSKIGMPSSVKNIMLADKSVLLFQSFDDQKNRFFDVFWIRNADDIYRIKYLEINTFEEYPKGHFVDHLIRNSDGEFIVAHSAEKMLFSTMNFNEEALFEAISPIEEESIYTLWTQLPNIMQISDDKQALILSTFYQKLYMPWMCLLVIIAPAPFCLAITRNLPLFFIYAGSIFGFIAVNVAMNAAIILGKRQVVDPSLAILPLFGLIMFVVVYFYLKLVTSALLSKFWEVISSVKAP